MTQKIYGGIYNQGSNQVTDLFLGDTQQIQMDSLMVPFYLWETVAHNLMMAKNGLIPLVSAKKILKELLELMVKVEKKGFVINPNKGDLHENIETWLTEEIGAEAGWFHLARSRNDQITCDQKLITKSLFFQLGKQLAGLGEVLGNKSQRYIATIMPGFTHLRSAMPSSFGFWWQAYLVQVIEIEKLFQSIYAIVDTNPLGAGASYGVNWPIETGSTTVNLGFSKPLLNALASINNRGLHELYWLGALVPLVTILSRMMEDVIIWSMPEIDLIRMSEEYTTGSSIMPQKINPDVAEKIRGKTGVLLGDYVQLATTLKGTASGYNRDTAETKIVIIQSLIEVISVVNIATQMLKTIVPNEKNMLIVTKQALATKVADQLAQKYKIPFRSAHQIIGASLKQSDYNLDQITAPLLKELTYKMTGMNIKISASWLANIIEVNQALSLYSYVGTPNPITMKNVNNDLLVNNQIFDNFISSETNEFVMAKQHLLQQVKTYLEE